MMIDTHTHLYLPEFDADNSGESAVNRAIDAGVEKMIFPNVGVDTVGPMLHLSSKFPSNVYCAIGLHPSEIDCNWVENLNRIMGIPNDEHPYVAIGEIGMDLYWEDKYREEQMQAFDNQCSLAEKMDLPIIIHCREALNETLEVLEGHPGIRGVFHSFGGNEQDVDIIRKTGDFYFGINGIVTFKNSKLRDVLPAIGLKRILLETDSPYLTPVPHRGKRNETAYLPYICTHIADFFGKPSSEISDMTTNNACSLFRL